MDSEKLDPKSQVPSVDPENDLWDIEQISDTPQVVLQPQISEQEILSNLERNPLTDKRYAPSLKSCNDEESRSIKTISIDVVKSAKSTIQAASETIQNSEYIQGDIMANAAAASPDPIKPELYPAVTAGANAQGTNILPSPTVRRESKSIRVYEINPQRSVENQTQKKPFVLRNKKGKRASNEALMKRRNIKSDELKSLGLTNVRPTLTWIIGAGAVAILILVGAMLFIGYRQDSKRTSDYRYNNESNKTSEPKVVRLIDKLLNAEDQAKDIFMKYATSKSVDDFMDVIYLTDKNIGLVTKTWQPMGGRESWRIQVDYTWTVSEDKNVPFGILNCLLPDYSNFFMIFRQEGDELKIDWKATTAHSSASFSELNQGQGEADEIRAIISPADFYTFSMPETEFRCYRLASSDNEQYIWAYTKINSSSDSKLAAGFISSQLTGVPLLEIAAVLVLERGSDDSLPNQWIVSDVVRMSWLDE